MKLNDIVHEAAVFLGKVKYLSGVPVIEEERGDVEKEVDIKIAQQQTAIIVGWSEFIPVKQSADVIVGDTQIVVSVFENITNNRATEGSPTIGNIALAVAKALTYAKADGMECPLFLKEITKISELGEQGGGTVTCDVVFKTKAEL